MTFTTQFEVKVILKTQKIQFSEYYFIILSTPLSEKQ